MTTPTNTPKPEPTKLTVTSVSWGKTINTGNFECVRFDITARVNPDQNWRDVLAALKGLVREQADALKK